MGEDRILLEGMVFFGRHGVLTFERELGQRFVVDLEMRLDLRPAGVSDDLASTVDYGEIHRRVRKIVEGEPYDLIEAVAERIAAAVLESRPEIEAVRVKITKPDVRLEGTILGGSAVEILRRKSF
ncbi:MAG: dihydroneopterin aldolase [Rubrobacteraceae bacterium]